MVTTTFIFINIFLFRVSLTSNKQFGLGVIDPQQDYVLLKVGGRRPLTYFLFTLVCPKRAALYKLYSNTHLEAHKACVDAPYPFALNTSLWGF